MVQEVSFSKHNLNNDCQQWLALAMQRHPNLDECLLVQAMVVASDLNVMLSYQAVSSLDKGLLIGNELLALHCDTATVATAIVYPGVLEAGLSEIEICSLLNKEIYSLISGVKRMDLVGLVHQRQSSISKKQIDNLRKMILAVVDDSRIVVIKLAETVISLQHAKTLPDALKLEIAEHASDLYAPLANRLGIGQLKWQLEDLSFRYLNPDHYKDISKALNMRRVDREAFIVKMEAVLIQLFADAHIKDVEISGRAKHIYSIYKKIERKKVDFTEIYDASALRILVPSIKDCYAALAIVHAKWPHIQVEFDDYIANPKPNGYRSIHTAITGDLGVNVEIQIRTFHMHEESELGVAAHWKYKEGSGEKEQYEKKLEYLRDLMDWQKNLENSKSSESSQVLYKELFEDRIYVFSPQGDVYDLPQGATPLDFAYHVHSQVGNRCKGAKVNGKLEPLVFKLRTADRVEIITGKEDHPSLDWLNPALGYITTQQAKSKIKSWFRKKRYQDNVAEGHVVWEKIARRLKVDKAKIKDYCQEFNYKNIDDLYSAIGSGDLSAISIANAINEKNNSTPTQSSENKNISKKSVSKNHKYDFIVEGVDDIMTHVAQCCMPIPGDDIVGYITTGRGVTIHKQQCGNILSLIESRPERFLKVSWNVYSEHYAVELLIEAMDRPGLVYDITGLLANERLAILGLSTHTNKNDGVAILRLTIDIQPHITLHQVIQRLLGVADVFRVSRP